MNTQRKETLEILGSPETPAIDYVRHISGSSSLILHY